MAVPVRSASERDAALAAALEARQERARLREALRERQLSGVDVLENASANPVWAALRVTWVLEALPGIGPARAARLMDEAGVAASRRVQGLGVRQRSTLIAALSRGNR